MPALLPPLFDENTLLVIAPWFSNKILMATHEFHCVFADPVETHEKRASQIS